MPRRSRCPTSRGRTESLNVLYAHDQDLVVNPDGSLTGPIVTLRVGVGHILSEDRPASLLNSLQGSRSGCLDPPRASGSDGGEPRRPATSGPSRSVRIPG